jgi:hypothetical protein
MAFEAQHRDQAVDDHLRMISLLSQMAEQILEKRLATGKSSKDAISWLKTALDPFHDYDVGIAGIPDADSQFSVVQIYPKVTSVTAPPSLAAGETWSCHITTLPLGQNVNVSSYDMADAYGAIQIGYDNGERGVLGTVNIITHGDSAATVTRASSFPTSFASIYGNASREFRAISVDDVGDQSLKKLIAGGFEVHNDTAELYKQGSVTVYQNSQLCYDAGYTNYRQLSASAILGNSSKACRQPPHNRENAASLPSSRTWEASKGCYVPIRLTPETGYAPATGHQFNTRLEDAADNRTNIGYMQIQSTGMTGVSNDDNKLAFRGCNIETTGAYFSGLSPETVLTVTTKLIIESAPTPANPSLLFSATPTPNLDSKILALYFETIRHLPPGVEVSMNAKGDWFRMVMKAANVGIPLIMPLLGANPGISLATQSALAGGNAIVKLMDKKKKKPQKASLNPPTMTKAVSRPNRA